MERINGCSHQFLENNVSFWIPSRRNALFEIEVKNKAALKIQSYWRGYKVRQLSKLSRNARERENAASLIQNAVRHWLYGKHKQSISSWYQIPDCRRRQIMHHIERWNYAQSHVHNDRNKDVTNECVKRRLNDWYTKASKREISIRKVQSLCAKLEATALVMLGPKTLANYDALEMDFYQCPSLALAVEARLDYKDKIQTLFAPWWKKIDLYNEDDEWSITRD